MWRTTYWGCVVLDPDSKDELSLFQDRVYFPGGDLFAAAESAVGLTRDCENNIPELFGGGSVDSVCGSLIASASGLFGGVVAEVERTSGPS